MELSLKHKPPRRLNERGPFFLCLSFPQVERLERIPMKQTLVDNKSVVASVASVSSLLFVPTIVALFEVVNKVFSDSHHRSSPNNNINYNDDNVNNNNTKDNDYVNNNSTIPKQNKAIRMFIFFPIKKLEGGVT